MSHRTWIVRTLSALGVTLCLVGSAQGGGPAYDLTGNWRLVALETEQSFCDGGQTQEVGSFVVHLSQAGEFITMIVPDPEGNEIFQGRTSNFFLALESNTAEATALINGTVSQDANRITGYAVLYDKDACPDAETGWARYQMTRIG